MGLLNKLTLKLKARQHRKRRAKHNPVGTPVALGGREDRSRYQGVSKFEWD
jgi:hypothetical protein